MHPKTTHRARGSIEWGDVLVYAIGFAVVCGLTWFFFNIFHHDGPNAEQRAQLEQCTAITAQHQLGMPVTIPSACADLQAQWGNK